MRIALGVATILVMWCLLVLTIILEGFGGTGITSATVNFSYALFVTPVFLGLYLIFGGSTLIRRTHHIFLAMSFVPFLIAFGIVLARPLEFDLFLALPLLGMVGLVVFGGFWFGLRRAPGSAYRGRIAVEPEDLRVD